MGRGGWHSEGDHWESLNSYPGGRQKTDGGRDVDQGCGVFHWQTQVSFGRILVCQSTHTDDQLQCGAWKALAN